MGERSRTDQKVKEIREDADFGRLMGLLAGYPLAMEVVLANLRRQSPGEVLGALQLADVGLDGVGQDKTTSILKCVEYSHSNLSESAQQLLLCLAPFSSFIWRDGIPLYAEELKKLEPFKDYDFAGFDDAIQEAINWGLLSPIDASNESLLSIQPVFPYFLQVRLNESTAETQNTLMDGFKNHYRNLAYHYENLMESKDSPEKRSGILFCRLEYENLYTALKSCLVNQESLSIYFCLDQYLNLINDIQNGLKIAEEVCQALNEYSFKHTQGELEPEIAMAFDRLGCIYILSNSYDKAKKRYEDNLQFLDGMKSIDSKQKKLGEATIYHQLGIVAKSMMKWDEAFANHSKSLEIRIKFDDRYSQASTYYELGSVLLDLREWDQAHDNFNESLKISIEFNDRYSQAKIYHCLGRVAQEVQKWDEAREYFGNSLEIKKDFDNICSQADTYQQLGIVAYKKGEFDEARKNYYESLAIYIQFGDQHSQAGIYNNLGIIAHELKDWDEAYNNYSKAMKIKIDVGDRYFQANTYLRIGMLADETGDLEQAKKNLLPALKIFAEFQDEYNVSIVIRILGYTYQSSKNIERSELLTAIAEILGFKESELQQIFDSMDQGT